MELSISLGLISLGYYLSNKDKKEAAESKSPVDNYYKLDNSKELEKKAAMASIKNREKTFIPSLEQPIKLPTHVKGNEIVSALSGNVLKNTDFKRRDDGKIFEPFFGKNITQSTKDLDIPNRRLEMNGFATNDGKKKEVGQFFPPTSNLTYIAGTPVMDQENIDRYHKTNKRNGELPFSQERVAPGIGQNYGNTGVGGFDQFETRDIAMPKTVDQMRKISNPKLTYKGRTISGKRINANRGSVGGVDKNRPETYYENSEERYFKTTGAHLKSKAEEQFIVKETNRQDSRFFVGGLKSDKPKHELSQRVKDSTKNVYKRQDPSNKTAKENWREEDGNYNKSGYKAYPNERDITQKRTHKNNVITAVKSLITPIQDAIKRTKKEAFTGNNRPEGNMNATVPKKQTVYDSNQVAKTTIKETLIHNNRKGALSGPTKLTTYDPNQIAKATTKETLIHNRVQGSMNSGLQQPKIVKYDTLPKFTLRNTMKNVDTRLNATPKGPQKLETFNKLNPPKTTVRETTEDKTREGFVGTRGKADGYKISQDYAPNTSRQFMSDNEYSGSANSMNKATTNYDAEYNASLNINKEIISRGRAPTQNNVKVANGADTINTINKKQQSGTAPPAPTEGLKHINTATEIGVKLSHHKDQLNTSQGIDRNQPDILEALKENPFAKSVTDIGPGPEFALTNKAIENNSANEQRKKEEEIEIERIIEAEIAKLL